MSRMNNTARSLGIISRQNGWDPDKIEGFGDIGPVYPERETPFTSTNQPVPAIVNDPTGPAVPNQGESRSIPADDRGAPSRTSNADPTPGMPGA